jgi:hypothetical protein
MTNKLIVKEDIGNQLADLKDAVELCDEAGRTLGHFVPEELFQRWLYASVDIPLSASEVERRRNESGGRSLSEIWEALGRA